MEKSIKEILENYLSTVRSGKANLDPDNHDRVNIATALLNAESAEKNFNSSERLGGKVFWLNVVLTAATVVGALATLVLAFK